ncbi:MAG: type II secretion system protein [Phycisphaerales bacterium]|nr:type II secretion system protein [Phycisphaerales bacterium]
MPRKPAFTLIELLVVVAIIALLVSILLPALGQARKCARHVKSASDLRELLMGYSAYHSDNRGFVLFGYAPGSVDGWNIEVRDPDSGLTFGNPVVNRYPWRILPYVANFWGVLFSHTKPAERPLNIDSPADAFMKAYMLSIEPTFGINAGYVGGYFNTYAGFIVRGATTSPNTGRHVVFRESEVRRTAELITFTDVKWRGGGKGPGDTNGYYWATPPRLKGEKWRAVHNRLEVVDHNIALGLPEGRFLSKSLTAFFDGHVDGRTPNQLADMRLWANWADDMAYDYVNTPR